MTIGEGRMVKGMALSLLMVSLICFSGQAAFAATDEENVGNAAAAKILAAAPLVKDAAVQEYLNLVGNGIAAGLQLPYRWRFGLIESDHVNAFALPGGVILVTRGMARLISNEDELAYVLSHEIAHVARKHHYKVVQRQRLAAKANTALESMGDGSLKDLAGASAQIYARGLDKSAEFEADRLGVEIMTRAGYDPAAALGVLDTLANVDGGDGKAEWLFATHPQPTQRIDQLVNAGIADLPPGKGMTSRAPRFGNFRARL